MEKPIKITKSLKFDFYDLMRNVDVEYEFTLRDVLRACMNSKICIEILQLILRCNYVEKYWEEANSKQFKKDSDIIYLELSWQAEIDRFEGKESSGSTWHFYGMGKKGVVPEDLLKHCTKKEINKMKKEKWQQSYAIEFTPIYKLVNYPIKIRKEICIADWRDHKKKKTFDDLYTRMDVQPNITLMELFYWIFWELSFCGSPEQRDEKKADLAKTIKELDKAREEGRLDEVTIPWKEVKRNLKKKIKKIQKKKKEKRGEEKWDAAGAGKKGKPLKLN